MQQLLPLHCIRYCDPHSIHPTIKLCSVHPVLCPPLRRSASCAPTDLYPKSPLFKNRGLKIHLKDLQLHPTDQKHLLQRVEVSSPSPAPRLRISPKLIPVASSSGRRTPVRRAARDLRLHAAAAASASGSALRLRPLGPPRRRRPPPARSRAGCPLRRTPCPASGADCGPRLHA